MLKNMSLFKMKLIPAIITTLNIGFVNAAIIETASEEFDTSLSIVISELLLGSIVISMYAAPVVFLAGILVSMGVDKITLGIDNTGVRNTLNVLLHLIAGIIIALFTFWVLADLPDLTNKEIIINFILLSVYPSLVFWLVDLLTNKNHV
ncbi:hypothetical protein [Oceanobacillus sp. J11TS1]|uniref:hypothetical protein n=1 Tax=Oceanobacillus sp. J11TS1 TaxID=2807191 RepID=UPI001B124AC3|nr:hypothetical protein [Oceanobacillus sp. J11TS1]GIO25030.1 hypothetical protein J11TS1_36110 [Oceanobacillus sp. J11TS1]